MTKKTQKITDIFTDISSSDQELALNAVEKFRKEGNLKVLPEFLELAFNNEHTAVHLKAQTVLYDLKDKSATPVIFEMLRTAKFKKHQAAIAATLWEANLDCSDKLPDLIDLCREADASTIIEITTVIENLDPVFSFDEIENYKLDLVEIIDQSEDDLKIQMLNSLLVTLDQIVE